MSDFAALPDLRPLPGGYSGETFVSDYGGRRVVVRVYGARSRRGPDAPQVDAAVMEMVRGLLPVPAVLEARPADPDAGTPGLLITELLPGERLDVVLPRLDDAHRELLGVRLGRLLGRLGHMVQPRTGLFGGPGLQLTPVPPEAADLPSWVAAHRDRLGWEESDLAALESLAVDAQVVFDEEGRHCLVHSDFNPKNLLVDQGTLRITGLVDWEFAHAGNPWSDLGNLLRFDREPCFVDGILTGLSQLLPTVPDDVLERAHFADLFALVELAARAGENPVADAAYDRLLRTVRARDPHDA
ncbi:MAG: phosphotransferase family protein [Marmoricola sp.]